MLDFTILPCKLEFLCIGCCCNNLFNRLICHFINQSLTNLVWKKNYRWMMSKRKTWGYVVYRVSGCHNTGDVFWHVYRPRRTPIPCEPSATRYLYRHAQWIVFWMGLAPVAQITLGCVREHSSIWLWSWGKATYCRTLFTCLGAVGNVSSHVGHKS